jgi:hypothetical protein
MITLARVKKILLIGIGGYIALMILGIGLTVAYIIVGNLRDKSYLNAHYKNPLPETLNLKSAKWTNWGVDVSAHWNYSYSTLNPDRTSLYTGLIKSLQAHGYTIRDGSCPRDDFIAALNDNNHIYLSVGLNPQVDNGSQITNVTSVTIEADKYNPPKNQDIIYSNTDPLSCAIPR